MVISMFVSPQLIKFAADKSISVNLFLLVLNFQDDSGFFNTNKGYLEQQIFFERVTKESLSNIVVLQIDFVKAVKNFLP